MCSAVPSCSERAAVPVRSAEQKRSNERKTNAAPCPREPGERAFRVHYFTIGHVPYAPATVKRVEKEGAVCCFKVPAETAQLTKILASATPPGIPADVFDERIDVRVIVKVNDDSGEKIMAIVEQLWDAESGVVTADREGRGQEISAAATADLKRLIETRCKWDDEM
jgi:hypothetical protein